MNLKKILLLLFLLLLIGGGIVGYSFYSHIYHPNTLANGALYIKTSSDLEQVMAELKPLLDNVNAFEWVARKKNYHNLIKPGKYEIVEGMNNNDLVDLLRSGEQVPVKVSFNNQDTLEKLAGRIALQIEADSTALLSVFQDQEFMIANGFRTQTALAMYVPNTYEFYWNTNAEDFRERMLVEYQRFWNPERLAKAEKQKLTPLEVVTLASIVQKETALVEERPIVAQLYLNRLNSGWPLQADPTIIFAMNQNRSEKMVIRRVLNKDLQIASPYNTYKYSGLPPGPIGMPDISSIEGVLDPQKHNYYYMCASVDAPGKHEFAESLQQHNRNAAKYQSWLNQQGIRR
jgi:UPF0755 protein